MTISFSQAYKEAIASADQTVTYVDTLVFTLPPDVLLSKYVFRFVRSDVDIEINGVLYTGKQFSYTIPQLESNSNSALQITITDAGREISLLMDKALKSAIPIKVQFASYIAGTVADTASFITEMEVQQVSVNNTDVILSAGYPDTVNKKVPAEAYTIQKFPGLGQG